MKEVKPLKFEELSLKQKLGMLDAAYIATTYDNETLDYVFGLIKNRELGAVWIQATLSGAASLAQRVKETADYPILIITDAESGIKEYKIGRHNAIGCTGSEAHAYAFGRAVAAEARKIGCNVVCNPVLDVKTNGSPRSYGQNTHEIARLAAAEARGMHDGGVLTVAKHYPSGNNPRNIDSHMAEGYSEQTKEELWDYSLYAYRELIKDGLLDGIMVGHHRFPNIDSNYPASLSKPTIDILKEHFDGFFITDALGMMGIVGKFGSEKPKGLCISAGSDLALTYTVKAKENHEAIASCYDAGIFDEKRLDDAVKRILAAQEKTMLTPKFAELDKENAELCKNIDRDAVYERVDDGVPKSISRDGKHLFAVMVRNEDKVGADGGVEVDTFSDRWLLASDTVAKIRSTFPNSKVIAFHQFPNALQMRTVLEATVECDETVFLTFAEPIAYTGREHLTRRAETLINAAQNANKVSTLIHFGNPCVLENLPHIPRHILAGLSASAISASIDILAGDYEAKGVLTYDAKLI